MPFAYGDLRYRWLSLRIFDNSVRSPWTSSACQAYQGYDKISKQATTFIKNLLRYPQRFRDNLVSNFANKFGWTGSCDEECWLRSWVEWRSYGIGNDLHFPVTSFLKADVNTNDEVLTIFIADRSGTELLSVFGRVWSPGGRCWRWRIGNEHILSWITIVVIRANFSRVAVWDTVAARTS